MIELFDAARLLPRRDPTLRAAGVCLLLGGIAVAAHAVLLQRQLDAVTVQRQALQAGQARRTAPVAVPTAALLAGLQRQAEGLEAEAAAGTGPAGPGLTGSQWLERLDALAGDAVALTHVEIDRAGSVRVEGTARDPKALSSYVQGWERLEGLAPVRARDIEVRQDAKAAALLRFALHAQAAGPPDAARAPP